MGTVSMVLGFYAVSMLPLADATAIAFSQPLFSVVRGGPGAAREGALAALDAPPSWASPACW